MRPHHSFLWLGLLLVCFAHLSEFQLGFNENPLMAGFRLCGIMPADVRKTCVRASGLHTQVWGIKMEPMIQTLAIGAPLCFASWLKWQAHKLATDDDRFGECFREFQERVTAVKQFDRLALVFVILTIFLCYIIHQPPS